MRKNKTNKMMQLLFIFVLMTNLFSHSRVAFSRPGTMIRTPSSLVDISNNKYYFGFANEWIGTEKNITSNAIYFKGTSANGYEFGLSYAKRAPINNVDGSSPNEFSFHFTKELYQRNNFIINVGIQDIFYESDSKNQISAFFALINKGINIGDDYILQSSVGFGTGKIRDDSYDYTTGPSNEMDIRPS